MAVHALDLNWSIVWDSRDQFWGGLIVALQVSLASLVLSLGAGVLLALGRMGKQPVAWLCTAYINVFRGIPALVSVIWVYFGWSLLIGQNFTAFQAGVIALTLLYSAFFAEIFRSALLAIPKGQREAGMALGMSRPRIFLSVILPQALKIAVPNIGSMFIGMVKDTSVFTVIGLVEILRVTQNINSTTFQPFVLYTTAAIIYVVLTFVIDFVFRTLERILATPTQGRLAGLFVLRRQRRLEAIMARPTRTADAAPPLVDQQSPQ